MRGSYDREAFLRDVQSNVANHPEIVPDLTAAARQGLMERMQRDQMRALDMETIALLALSRLPKGKLQAQDRTLILDRLRRWEGQTCFTWNHDLERLGINLDEEGI